MDRYKFGNNICKLREERGLTQEQFANMLGVTDKAVSKWENGQSIPRMETLENMAIVLAMPLEALITAGKDNTTLLCFQNDFSFVVHLDIDGRLVSIPVGESEWIDVNPNGFNLNIKPYWNFEEFHQAIKEIEAEETKLTEKLKAKALGVLFRKGEKYVQDATLIVDCTYECKGFQDGDVITIDSEVLNLENRFSSILSDFILMVYPIIKSKNGTALLKNVAASNGKEFVKRQKKLGLGSDLGFGFLPMLMFYPIRSIYFKHLCKPKTIMKNINNVELLRIQDVEEDNSKKKKGCGCLSLLLLIPLLFVGFMAIDLGMDIIFIESSYPALVASDYSQITYYDEVYTRIEALPDNAYPELMFNYATIWENARMDGLSRFDQFCSDNMVQLFADRQGNKYLWLVENYTDTILIEDGKEYDDFTEHYVYMLESEE